MSTRDVMFVDRDGQLRIRYFGWFEMYIDGFARRQGREHIPDRFLLEEDFVFATLSHADRPPWNPDFL